ncbi:hypothetical protein GCM10010267_06890 [Streptomyces griseorubens]|nr:hypothetical protein GCM10010267_06890 [Streptomyces griseorubens]
MQGQVHAALFGDPVRAVVIGEAPGADQRARPLGQRPPHVHRTRTAEGDLSRRQDIDREGSVLPAPVHGSAAVQSREISLRVAHLKHPSI